jgi:PBP1b-binding outer membrane lipoprotein LpoB
MKKVLAFVVLAAFISACSQYTCPTYSKKETKKETVLATKRI